MTRSRCGTSPWLWHHHSAIEPLTHCCRPCLKCLPVRLNCHSVLFKNPKTRLQRTFESLSPVGIFRGNMRRHCIPDTLFGLPLTQPGGSARTCSGLWHPLSKSLISRTWSPLSWVFGWNWICQVRHEAHSHSSVCLWFWFSSEVSHQWSPPIISGPPHHQWTPPSSMDPHHQWTPHHQWRPLCHSEDINTALSWLQTEDAAVDVPSSLLLFLDFSWHLHNYKFVITVG